MAEPDRDFARKLAELRRLFVEGFAPRLRDMEVAFAGLDRNEATERGRASIAALRAAAHKLTGTAGTFGFDVIAEAAAAIEERCDGLIAAGKPPSDDDRRALERSLDVLRKGCA